MKHNQESKRPHAGDKGPPPKPVRGPKAKKPAPKPAKKKKTDLSAAGAAETIRLRKAYNAYRIEAVTSGGTVQTFDQWRQERGVQPPVGGGT